MGSLLSFRSFMEFSRFLWELECSALKGTEAEKRLRNHLT